MQFELLVGADEATAARYVLQRAGVDHILGLFKGESDVLHIGNTRLIISKASRLQAAEYIELVLSGI